MDRKHKIIQVYAVIINIVAVITVIISTTSLVSALIDQSAPLYAGRYEENLTSFENFKMDALRSTDKDQAYIPSDEELSIMFDAAKMDKINLVQHQSRRTVIVSGFIIFISLVLFALHWYLMRRVGKDQEQVSTS